MLSNWPSGTLEFYDKMAESDASTSAMVSIHHNFDNGYSLPVLNLNEKMCPFKRYCSKDLAG